MGARYFLPFLFLLTACNQQDEDTQAVFKQPPFASLTDSIRQEPKNADLYYRRSGLLQQNELWNLAEADLRKAWSLRPDEKYALELTGLLERKSEDSALLFARQAASKLPQSLPLQVSLAKEYRQLNQLEQALSICNQIIERYPGQLDALELKSDILQAQHKDGESLAVLEKAHRLAPSDAELSFNLAFRYAQAKDPRALTLSDSLIRMDASGRHAEPYYFKGLYYENTGNHALALSFFNQAILHDYYFIDAYMDKGKLQYDGRQFDQALKTFQLATTVSPTFADAYYWMGKAQQALGQKSEARLNYQRAYGLDPTLTEAKEAEKGL